MMWKKWLRAALVRAVRTFAQSFGSMITVGAALAEVDWVYILSVAAVAAIYSVVTSLAGLPEVSGGSGVLAADDADKGSGVLEADDADGGSDEEI